MSGDERTLMRKGLVWAVLAVLLANTAAAMFISDYPKMFFQNRTFTGTVVRSAAGDSAERYAANMLINELQREATRRGLRATAVKISTQKASGNELVVGTPCGNLRVRQLLNISPGKCREGLPAGQGLLKIIDDGNIHLLVTGADADSVLDAAKVLADSRQQLHLRVTSAAVVRKLYQKYYITEGRKFLDIGQVVGVDTPAIYSDYPYVTYQPFGRFHASDYGAIVTTDAKNQRAYMKLHNGSIVTG
jgi:hypothetical protein